MLSKKVVYKSGEYLGNKTADAIAKSNDDNIGKQEPVEEVIIPPKKKRRNIKQTEKTIIKMEHYKMSKLLHNSTVLKFVRKNGLK